MKAKLTKTLMATSAVAFSCLPSYAKEVKLTTADLLKEMTNRAELAQFPAAKFTTKQFSSYCRASNKKDGKNWFANKDWDNYIRIENKDGHKEQVMLDVKGPGAISRFWLTMAGAGSGKGVLRIYLDDNEKATFTGTPYELISRNAIAPYPLAISVSELSHETRRGHNLYMPLLYNESCKITYQPSKEKHMFYYNVMYRTYDKNQVELETTTPEMLKKYKVEILETANDLLSTAGHNIPRNHMKQASKKLTEADSNNTIVIKTDSPKAINNIEVMIDAKNINQALRSTVLKISFDNKNTVWVPVGDFFGGGYKKSKFMTYMAGAIDDTHFVSRWIMPFKKEAKVELVNFSTEPVQTTLKVNTEKYNWNDNSLYFGSVWNEFNHKMTVKASGHSGKGAVDLNYVTLENKGRFVGVNLVLFNTANGPKLKWWGEGDEKIYVDNNDFPVIFGTGSEDYFGYAWCRKEKFVSPFIAQVWGDGDLTPGFTTNTRYHLLDSIPFEKSFTFDMELWHWQKCRINYAPTAYFYVQDLNKLNIPNKEDLVKLPVRLK